MFQIKRIRRVVSQQSIQSASWYVAEEVKYAVQVTDKGKALMQIV